MQYLHLHHVSTNMIMMRFANAIHQYGLYNRLIQALLSWTLSPSPKNLEIGRSFGRCWPNKEPLHCNGIFMCSIGALNRLFLIGTTRWRWVSYTSLMSRFLRCHILRLFFIVARFFSKNHTITIIRCKSLKHLYKFNRLINISFALCIMTQYIFRPPAESANANCASCAQNRGHQKWMKRK